MSRIGFTQKARRKVKVSMKRELDVTVNKNMPKISRDSAKSVIDLDVYDTGETFKNTKAEYKSSKNTIVFSTRGVKHSKYPFFGLGTNARHGRRDWLSLGASKAVQTLGLKRGNLPKPTKRYKK